MRQHRCWLLKHCVSAVVDYDDTCQCSRWQLEHRVSIVNDFLEKIIKKWTVKVKKINFIFSKIACPYSCCRHVIFELCDRIFAKTKKFAKPFFGTTSKLLLSKKIWSKISWHSSFKYFFVITRQENKVPHIAHSAQVVWVIQSDMFA